MSSEVEENERNSREHLEEFLEIYSQLSRWGRFQVDMYLAWLTMHRRWGKVIWDWLVFQWEFGERVKRRLTLLRWMLG